MIANQIPGTFTLYEDIILVFYDTISKFLLGLDYCGQYSWIAGMALLFSSPDRISRSFKARSSRQFLC